eukprot:sb/3472914/
MSCDPDDGQCNCKELEDGSGLQDRINSRQCDGCYSDWYDSLFNYIDEDTLECTECQCHPQGARSRECHLYTGQCECREVYYTGINCDILGCVPTGWEKKCLPDNEGSCDGYIYDVQYQVQADVGDYSSFTKTLDCGDDPIQKFLDVETTGSARPCNACA